MLVNVSWTIVGDDDDPSWGWSRVLYAYLHPRKPELLYVGKAWGTTVRSRWGASDKVDGVFAFLNGIGIREHEVLVGDLSFDGRLTPQLLADVESLIILATNPIANVAGCKSRNLCRPGLVVRNRGRAWCGPRELRDGDSYIEIRS